MRKAIVCKFAIVRKFVVVYNVILVPISTGKEPPEADNS
jgi:hypothetical protein